MQLLPLINEASATVSKAELHRALGAKSCLLFYAPITRSLQSRAVNKQEFGQVAL